MSAISQIRSSLLAAADSSSGSKASGGSTISGKGLGATFDRVDISGQLTNLKGAFQRSAVRLSDGLSKFEITAGRLESLLSITEDLLDLAEKSADVTASAEDRAANNRLFQKEVGNFNDILEDSEADGVDLSDRDELANALSGTGADLNQITTVSTLFEAVAGADNVVGFARVVNETLTSPVALSVNPEVQFVAGTLAEVKASDEGTAGGTGITFGKVLATATADSADSIVATTGNYNDLNAGKLQGAVQLAGDGSAKEFETNPAEDVRVYDLSTDGKTIALVGSGANSKVVLANFTTLAATQDEIDTVNESTQAANIDASLSADGSGFVYVNNGTLKHGSVSDYETSGSSSLTTVAGTTTKEIDAGNTGFVFTSSDAALGADGTNNSLYYVDAFSGGSTIQIDDPSGGSIEKVAISDDGTQIAFTNDTGELFIYDVDGASSTKTNVSVSTFSEIDFDADGDTLAVIEDNGTYDRVVIFDVTDPSSTTETANHSFVDDNLKVKELSINSAGDAFSYVVDTGLTDDIDEVLFGKLDGSGTQDSNFDVNLDSYRISLTGADVEVISDTAAQGGSTIYNNTTGQNGNNSSYFDSDADYGYGGTGRQATVARTGGLQVIGQYDNADNDLQIFDSNSDGSFLFAADTLDGGDVQLTIYDSTSDSNTTELEVVSGFEAANFKASLSQDANNYIYGGAVGADAGIQQITYTGGELSLSTGTIQDFEAADNFGFFFSDTTDLGGEGATDIYTVDFRGGEPTRIDLGANGVDTVNTATLSTTGDGDTAVFADASNLVHALDANSDTISHITLENSSGTIVDLTASNDGQTIAALVDDGGNTYLRVYSGHVSDGDTTFTFEYEYDLGSTLDATYSDLEISNDGSVISYVSNAGDGRNDLYTATRDQAPTPYSARSTNLEAPVEAPGGSNPLNQDISTVGGALIAKAALTQLSDDIERDLGAVQGIVKELRSSLAFALQGARSSNELLGSQLISGPEAAAERIRQDILSNPEGFELSHGNLDTILNKDLELL